MGVEKNLARQVVELCVCVLVREDKFLKNSMLRNSVYLNQFNQLSTLPNFWRAEDKTKAATTPDNRFDLEVIIEQQIKCVVNC